MHNQKQYLVNQSLYRTVTLLIYEYLTYRNWENKKEIEENLAKKYTTQILPTLYQELKTDIKDEKESLVMDIGQFLEMEFLEI